jgi:hypothetical protein
MHENLILELHAVREARQGRSFLTALPLIANVRFDRPRLLHMRPVKYGVALVVFSLCALFLHQHGEFHRASGSLVLQGSGGGSDSPLACVDAASADPVTDLALLPGGGVLVASMSANASQPGRISLLSSAAFSPASGAPQLQPVLVSGFSAQLLRPKRLHVMSHSEGTLLFVVQQWPAANRVFERYMQQRGAKRDEGLPRPLTSVEVFLVVQEQAAELQLIHQRSLQHSSLDTVTSIAAVSPSQLFAATSCFPHTASWWKLAAQALSSLACCSSILQLDIDCGSEENCFDTHLGGELSGLMAKAHAATPNRDASSALKP